MTDTELEELVNQSDDSETGDNFKFEYISGRVPNSMSDSDLPPDENDINKAFENDWIHILQIF